MDGEWVERVNGSNLRIRKMRGCCGCWHENKGYLEEWQRSEGVVWAIIEVGGCWVHF